VFLLKNMTAQIQSWISASDYLTLAEKMSFPARTFAPLEDLIQACSGRHPETYPKYQEQLQRVALLRDMINWCIENPVKGKTLSPDDPKMRALEAYIMAQRKGVAMEYGKHLSNQ